MFADYPQEPQDLLFQYGSSLIIPSQPWMEISEPMLSEFQVTQPSPIGSLAAGFDLGSNWPVVAIIGIGGLIVFRGKKKERHMRRRSRRKRKR